MKKLLLIFGGIAGFSAVFSQTLSPQVVANGGRSFSGASGGMEFTIGEVATSTLSSSGNVLTQGFNQPKIDIVGVEEIIESYSINLFPNPAQQFLNLETTSDEELEVSVFNALGQIVFDSRKFRKELSLDVQNISDGKYFLRVNRANGDPVKNFTFLKLSN
ncbi:MAG: T9SS type A sorting domain-containing protein [Bacteroidia bacterium]|nr:T9SS type A sorting domain-containing protein [Bacteroidia bacterium]